MKRQLEVIERPIGDLKPFDRNSRSHSAEQIDQVAASIEEFGWTNPILVDEALGVVAGHARLEAARRLGAEVVPTIMLTGLSDEQRRAYVIADNKLALNAGWNIEMLTAELTELGEAGFDLGLTGFSPLEIADLTTARTAGRTDPDDVPPVPERPVSRRGDRWMLGRHRLVCGDATSREDVALLLAGVEPHLMVTDPPYGVNYDPSWRKRAGLAGEGIAAGKVRNDDRADWREAWALFPGDVAYVWHAGVYSPTVADSLAATGFEMRALVVWAKSQLVIGRGHYHHMHEPCWYAVRKGGTGHWHGDRKQTTLWSIEHRKSETGHGTQKPVEAMARPIRNNSSPGQAVYDPFLGSGTTIIAAEMEGRSCLGLELDRAYCDVIVKRWQEFTGQEARLDAPGCNWTFAEVADNRPEPEESAA